MKILILDDIQEYVNSLARALSLDYEIIKAYSLEEAQSLMNDSINLVLSDVRLSEDDMANRDGILFLGWIKENYPKTKVIMMSAYRDFDSVKDSLNLKAEHYLSKPINLRELKDILKSFSQENL